MAVPHRLEFALLLFLSSLAPAQGILSHEMPHLDLPVKFSKELAAAAGETNQVKSDAQPQQTSNQGQDDDDDNEEDATDENSAAATRTDAIIETVIETKTAAPSLVQKAAAPLKKVALLSMASAPSAAAAAPAPALPAGLEEEESPMQTAKIALKSNLAEQKELQAKIDHLNDQEASDDEIDASAALVANQTESQALGDMMGNMWKDMRTFEVPAFSERAQTELEGLKQAQQQLEQQLQNSSRSSDNVKKQEVVPESKAGGEQVKQRPSSASQAATEKKLTSTAVSPLGFWSLTAREQLSYVASSLVYIVAATVLAYFYEKHRNTKDIFRPEPRPDIHPKSDNFSFHIFGCCGAPHISVVGCLCPCLRWADTLDRNGLLSFWKAFALFLVLDFFVGFTCGLSLIGLIAVGAWFRQKLREKFEIENGTRGSIFTDIALWTFCTPCAIIQEAREESVRLASLSKSADSV